MADDGPARHAANDIPDGEDLSAEAGELRAQIAELAAATNGLADRYDRLAEQNAKTDETVGETVHAHERTIQRLRRVAVLSTLGLVLDLGLSGWLMYTSSRVSAGHNKIAANQQQITAIQQRTGNEALCPLFGLFLNLYNPKAQPPEKLAKYEADFAVLRRGYEALGCPPQVVPSPSPSPPPAPSPSRPR